MLSELTKHYRKSTKTAVAGVVTLSTIAAGFLFGLWRLGGVEPLVDEYTHSKQILALLGGEWIIVDRLTTIPGYHSILAFMAAIIGRSDIVVLRLYNVLLSVAVTLLFYLTARSASTDIPLLRTAQCVFLPILYPFLFLVYTDVTSLLFILLAVYSILMQRHSIAALAGFLSMLIRQLNIVWFAMSFVWTAFQLARQVLGPNERLTALVTDDRHRENFVKLLLSKTIWFIPGFIAFAVFLAINGGIAIGDVTAHPFPKLFVGNLYFALFVAFIVFLPLHVSNLNRIIYSLRLPITWITLCLLLFVYSLAFAPDHPYNTFPGTYLLRNVVLQWSSESWANRSLLFLAIAVSMLSLSVTKLRSPADYLLFPFSAAALLPSWLIEPRYYIVPFVLFLIFRERLSIKVEYILTGYLIFLSLYVTYGIGHGRFFP